MKVNWWLVIGGIIGAIIFYPPLGIIGGAILLVYLCARALIHEVRTTVPQARQTVSEAQQEGTKQTSRASSQVKDAA